MDRDYGIPMTELPDWARQLDMAPHPEGGWYKETWRSELTVPQSALPLDYTGPRSAGTAILFLLMPGQQSAWHTVRSAEVWLYHSGGPLLLEAGPEQNTATTYLLGADILAGESPQIRHSTGSLAARQSARRPALPRQLCRGAGIRLRRLRSRGASRLSDCPVRTGRTAACPAFGDPASSASPHPGRGQRPQSFQWARVWVCGRGSTPPRRPHPPASE